MIYEADRKLGEQLWRRVRRRYRRWKAGTAGMLCGAGICLGLLWHLTGMLAQEALGPAIALTAGVLLLPVIGMAFCRALAVSGGMDARTRPQERLHLTEKSILLEYAPGRWENVPWVFLRQELAYDDLQAVRIQDRDGIVTLTGTVRIGRFTDMQRQQMQTERKENGELVLYPHYRQNEEWAKELYRHIRKETVVSHEQ